MCVYRAKLTQMWFLGQLRNQIKNQGKVAISVFSHKMARWIRITDHELEESKYRQKHVFAPSFPELFRLNSV